MLLNSQRDVGVFWLRLGMYIGLCVCLGTVYYQMGSNWKIVTARGGLLFFTFGFLTFMSVSGFPSFVDDMKVRDVMLCVDLGDTHTHSATRFNRYPAIWKQNIWSTCICPAWFSICILSDLLIRHRRRNWIVWIIAGYCDPISITFGGKNKYFLGRPKQYIFYKKTWPQANAVVLRPMHIADVLQNNILSVDAWLALTIHIIQAVGKCDRNH